MSLIKHVPLFVELVVCYEESTVHTSLCCVFRYVTNKIFEPESESKMDG